MTHKSKLLKTTTLTLAATIFAGGLLPLSQASAHDRHSAGSHGVHNQKWNNRVHRKFHNAYGRGNHGTRVYTERYGQRYHKKRKRSKGDLVAAGAIGLVLGAIIASESNKQHRRSAPQPTYNYDGYGQSYNNNRYEQRVPLNQYNDQPRTPYVQQGDPEVITYNDTASLEPWSPGWREWCTNRYRSFNVQTGTFRGYDGFDHFCVPK